MSKYYEEPLTEHMHEILVNNGIQLRTTEQFLKINGARKMESISTNVGEYEVNAMVFAVGFKPRADLLPELERGGSARAYKVNLFGQTSDPDIYASRDCATVWHSILEVDAYIALGSNDSSRYSCWSKCGNKFNQHQSRTQEGQRRCWFKCALFVWSSLCVNWSYAQNSSRKWLQRAVRGLLINSETCIYQRWQCDCPNPHSLQE